MFAAVDVGIAGTGPVVVLIHGQPGSAQDWSRVIPLLATHHRVIAVDRPGYRGDPAPPTDWAGNALALLAMLDRLNIERFVVVGHSYGGGVALETALRAPDRVAHLVLAGSVGHRLGVRGTDRVLAWSATGRLGRALSARAGDRVARMLERSAGSQLDELGRELMRGGLSMADARRAFESAHLEQRFFLRDTPGLDAQLGDVAVPTTVVVGYRDGLVPVRAQVALAAAIPGATLVPLTAGHLLTLEAHTELAQTIRDAADSAQN